MQLSRTELAEQFAERQRLEARLQRLWLMFREHRIALGISQSRLARLSGVSRFKICTNELGDAALTEEGQCRIRFAGSGAPGLRGATFSCCLLGPPLGLQRENCPRMVPGRIRSWYPPPTKHRPPVQARLHHDHDFGERSGTRVCQTKRQGANPLIWKVLR